MTRSARILAVIATILPLVGAAASVVPAGGCSGPEGPLPQAERDEAGDKVAQDKMREFMQSRAPKGKVQKGTR